MKKISLLIMFLIGTLCTEAQSYIGFLTDNYSGVNSVISNPANIVDSRFKTDINLAGVSAFGGNDYYGVDLFDAIKDGYDFDLESKKSPSNSNSGAVNIDVLGPAFMFNLNSKSAIAVFSRGRAFLNVNDINGRSIDAIDDDTSDNFNVNEGDFTAFSQAWAEIGLTYARVLMHKDQHFLKGGLTLKYLQGLGSGYLNGNNVTVNYDAEGIDLGGGETDGTVDSEGNVTFGRFANFDNDDYDYEVPDNANGFGVDLGFTYEWRPDFADYKANGTDDERSAYKDVNKYKLKIGLSVTDIGQIKYDDGIEETFNINNNVSEQDIDDEDDLNGILNNLYTLTNSKTGYTTSLPTAIHLNADWRFNNKLYLNLNTDLSLISKSKTNASRISNIVSLTPRFESKWFSFYVPLSVIENNGFQTGVGLRAGPLYLGSGSIVSALISDEIKGADVYAGLKIPVYQGRPKDRDADGVIDKLDGCPKIAGPIENKGCPWGDNDGDSILDNEDECPDQVGPAENNGCPWGDKDGDLIRDNVDDCPDEFGSEENNGCPFKDTDGDGVLDKDDNCIDVVGTVANNGCPESEVTAEVQKILNDYAKTILFNSGKSSIKEESKAVLAEITKILKEYPNAKFSIEGHTDSAGSNTLNQRLSDARANAVKLYLVENNIDAFRLSSIGYGEDRPIADNTTKTGRAQNRRVEINLVK